MKGRLVDVTDTRRFGETRKRFCPISATHDVKMGVEMMKSHDEASTVSINPPPFPFDPVSSGAAQPLNPAFVIRRTTLVDCMIDTAPPPLPSLSTEHFVKFVFSTVTVGFDPLLPLIPRHPPSPTLFLKEEKVLFFTNTVSPLAIVMGERVAKEIGRVGVMAIVSTVIKPPVAEINEKRSGLVGVGTMAIDD